MYLELISSDVTVASYDKMNCKERAASEEKVVCSTSPVVVVLEAKQTSLSEDAPRNREIWSLMMLIKANLKLFRKPKAHRKDANKSWVEKLRRKICCCCNPFPCSRSCSRLICLRALTKNEATFSSLITTIKDLAAHISPPPVSWLLRRTKCISAVFAKSKNPYRVCIKSSESIFEQYSWLNMLTVALAISWAITNCSWTPRNAEG